MGSARLGGTTGQGMTGLVLSLGPKNRIKHMNDIYMSIIYLLYVNMRSMQMIVDIQLL
jgi:hypothetical protein